MFVILKFKKLLYNSRRIMTMFFTKKSDFTKNFYKKDGRTENAARENPGQNLR